MDLRNKAAVYTLPGTATISIEELPVPDPEQGQILVKLSHSGVCHSDLAVCMQSWPILPFPTLQGQVGGHEGVGVVVAHGRDVSSPPIGTRVGIKWLADVCGSCDACLEGDDNTCAHQKISGYYTPGTFQQYVITSAKYATPIPDEVRSAEAAPILCAGLTVYSALLKSNTSPGDWIVISGAGGGLGHLAVQYASRVTGLRVIAIDHGSKKDLAESCGAEIFFDFTKYTDVELAAAVKQATNNGRGANAVLVVNAANKAYELALLFLKPMGTLVCVGMPEGQPVPIQSACPARITNQQFRIVAQSPATRGSEITDSVFLLGSAIGSRREAIEALRFVARGLVKCHYTVEKMENLGEIFNRMNAGTVEGRVVLDLS
ncbi:Alcohol dehydrogenase 2 [Talaromyces pinophilus]|nr:Alcohol dehydrogenase 2 [Talaromyces pinophilus]